MADFPKYDSGEPTAWSFREYDESDGSPVNWTKTADSHAHIATLKREWDEENGARYVEIELPSDKQVGGDHYKNMAIQPSEFIYKNNLNWLQGNAIKYICRHNRKHGNEDLDKAIHYLELLKEWEYGNGSDSP